ncbi:MAG TPA: hypothetical protein VI954_01895 [Candidatus Paceibacterota bacterium]
MNRVEPKENITELRKEVELLRSFVIGFIGKDRDGKYRPGFVRRILKATDEKPSRAFANQKAFLRELRD